MEFIALNKALSKIQGNEDIRMYLKTVAQDPQNETIDYAQTKKAVDAAAFLASDAFTARLTLITHLNNIFFVLHAIREENKYEETAKAWLWENHTRLNKMVAAAMVLEGNNLRGFGAKPERSDIPQSLVRLNGWIWENGWTFKGLANVHAATMTENGSDEFYALYTGQE